MLKSRIAIHISCWLAYYLYGVLGIWLFKTADTNLYYSIALKFSYTLSHMAAFYYCYAIVMPALYKRKYTALYIPAALLAPCIFVIVRYTLEQVSYPALLGFSNYGADTSTHYYLLDNIYRGLPAIAISAALWGLEKAYETEKINKLLTEEKNIAELAFLRSQINPHFLYNTLNYFYSIAYPLSDKLGDAIINLSRIMRYMFREDPDGKVDIRDEVEYIQHYISIYEKRFEDEFYVTFNYDIDIIPGRIAPLLLLPLVENAFKHGVVKDRNNPISLNLKTNANELQFSVTNKINKNQKDNGSGVGLSNIKRRLKLIYPEQHQLIISDDGNDFQISLLISFTEK